MKLPKDTPKSIAKLAHKQKMMGKFFRNLEPDRAGSVTPPSKKDKK